MSFRAVAIGLFLALVISGATYFNDWVIGQTLLIGNDLPISVFGVAILLLFGLNPLLRRLSEKLPLRPGEIGVIVAIGLAACGWPGSNYFRGFTTITAYPAHWLKTKANWQSAHVMSYVPGASAEFGEGHIQDWKLLGEDLAKAKDSKAPSPARQLWDLLPPNGQRSFTEGLEKGFDSGRTSELTLILDTILSRPELWSARAFQNVKLLPRAQELAKRPLGQLAGHELVERNRWLLVSAFPKVFLPPPGGEGVLFDGGRADPFAMDTLVQGRSKNQQLSVRQLPWAKWWPTIRLWGGVALMLAFASLCMALVVHPQWSKRELLPYPIARFLDEASARKEGSRLPEVATSRLFWIGLGAMVVLHLVNGLHAWHPEIPEIERSFNFWGLSQIFNNAVRVSGSHGYFGPTFYASVIAFSFFLSSSVSFSLGSAHILYMMFVSALMVNGIRLESGFADANGAMMIKFGAFLAVAIMIIYTGRRHYLSVAKGALGVKLTAETPRYAVWAARLGMISVVTSIGLLRGAGVGWGIATAFIGMLLLIFLVFARVVAETGLFFMQHWWGPIGVLTAMLGFEAIGPSTYIALSVATSILHLDSRELLMPYITNALKIVDRKDGPTPPKAAPWLAITIVVGFVVAGVTTLYLQYNKGATQVGNPFGTDRLPLIAFEGFVQRLSAASADGTLTTATALHGWDRIAAFKPDPDSMGWLLVGLALGFGAAVARLRWSWWPLHPVAFLMWGIYPIAVFGPSFLLGWMIKTAVVGTTGARGYHQVKPLMVGVIAGELISGLFWMVVGASYYFITDKAPATYAIFPS